MSAEPLTTEDIVERLLARDDKGWLRMNNQARAQIIVAACKGVEPKQEHVVKTGGDYSFEGVVVARFHKLSGKERVVVENSDGILHIFNPTQLSPSKQEVAGASEGEKTKTPPRPVQWPDDIVEVEQAAFNRGVEAAAAKIASWSWFGWQEDMLKAIRALKNTGETGVQVTLCRDSLSKRVERLEGALREMLDACVEDAGDPDEADGYEGSVGVGDEGEMALTFEMMSRARAALAEEGE